MRTTLMIMAASVWITLAATAATVDAQAKEPQQKVMLSIPKMDCGGCELAVKIAARKVAGVREVATNSDKRIAEVTYDAAATNVYQGRHLHGLRCRIDAGKSMIVCDVPRLGGGKQRLRWYAADVDARAANLCALDHHNIQMSASRMNRRGKCGAAGSNDGQVIHRDTSP